MGGRLNLDGGTLNLDGGTLTLDGGTRPPYNLSSAYSSVCNVLQYLYFLTMMGFCSVLISMIDFEFHVMHTKFSILAVSRLSS